MIRVNGGNVEMRGSIPFLLSELTVICKSLSEAIINDGRSVTEAKEHLQKSLELAFMTKEELDDEVNKSLQKATEDLIDILLKGLGE